MTHTRWWIHEIGDTNTLTRPVIATARSSSPARLASMAARIPYQSTTMTARSQGSRHGPPSRMKMPWSDWFVK